MPDPLYTVDEAADFLRVGRTTVFSLIKSRELRSLSIRDRRLIPESAIDEYVRARLSAADEGE